MTVRGFEVQPVLVNTDAAIPDMDAALRFPTVVPELAAGARIDGPDMIGHREIKNAVDFERSGLDLSVAGEPLGPRIEPVHPRQTQVLHVP